MGIEEPGPDLFQGSFDVLCESVKERILGNDSRNNNLLKVISQLDGLSNGSSNYNRASNYNGTAYQECYTYEEEVENECTFEDSDSSSIDISSDDNAYGSQTTENSDRAHLNFRKALENILYTYNNVKFDDTSTRLIAPPPVPVTNTFRKHNPEAANIFDFYDNQKEDISEFSDLMPVSELWNATLRSSINTCLVNPKDLDKEYKLSYLNQEKLSESLKYGDCDPKDYYRILKVLFGWYFSGYYTARMDLVAQLDKKQ